MKTPEFENRIDEYIQFKKQNYSNVKQRVYEWIKQRRGQQKVVGVMGMQEDKQEEDKQRFENGNEEAVLLGDDANIQIENAAKIVPLKVRMLHSIQITTIETPSNREVCRKGYDHRLEAK